MPITIRPYRRFLPLVYCSGVWSLITVLLLTVGPAYGEWVMVTTNETEGRTVYADSDTMRRQGDLVKMWALYDYKTERLAEGVSSISSKRQYECDCAGKRLRLVALMEFSGHMGSGNLVYRFGGEERWERFSPGSLEHSLWTVACKKQ